MRTQEQRKIVFLTECAVLIAIELIMSFTPLGFLRVGVVEITFMTIPVALGAMLLGPMASLLLGTVFGIASFVQCFGISAFGTLLFGINPVGALVLCIVPRALMGYLCGVIFRGIRKGTGKDLLAFTVTSFSAAAMNTIFFVLTFALFFHGATLDFGGGSVVDISQMNLIDILVFIAGVNGLVEVGVCTVLSTAIGKALVHFVPKLSVNRAGVPANGADEAGTTEAAEDDAAEDEEDDDEEDEEEK